MKRIKRLLCPLVLAAILMAELSGAGNPITITKAAGATPGSVASADKTIALITQGADATPLEPAAVGELLSQVKAATDEVMKSSVAKVSTSFGIQLAESPIKIDMTTLTDPVSHIFKTTTKVGSTVRETYSDLTGRLTYSYNKDRGCYEFAPMSKSVTGNAVGLESIDSSLLEKISAVSSFSLNPAATFASAPCTSVNIDIKANEKQVRTIAKNVFKSFESTLDFTKAIMKEFKKDPLDLIKSFDAEIHIYINPETSILLGMDFEGIIGIDLGMEPIPIVITEKSTNEISLDPVTLPPETATAVLAADIKKSIEGLTFTSTARGEKTIFTVTSVTKMKAKTLTIPATLSSCGSSYPVSEAAQNVFRQAKKLKTLIVKDLGLKKVLIKSPGKYGLPSNINIK